VLSLHGVFLSWLGLALAWNLWVSRGAARRLLVPLLAGLALVLLRDRLAAPSPSWLEAPWIAALFPAAFVAGLLQNLHALRTRGVRLTDVPIVAHNLLVGLGVGVAAAALHGHEFDAVLLYDYSVLQRLVGSHLAHLATLSWHLPLLVRREPPRTVPGLALGVVPAAYAAFAALILVLFHGEAQRVVASFAGEPRVDSLPTGLATGVLSRPPTDDGRDPPGSWTAWVLQADDPLEGLDRPAGPLLVALGATRPGLAGRPSAEEALATFVEGAERIARRLRPEVLLPFPEPDGEAPLMLGEGLPPERWRALFQEVGRRVGSVSPETRLGVRLAGIGDPSRAVFDALSAPPAVVAIAGPRLQPGSSALGGPALADAVLAAWGEWTGTLDEPPELWILAAGLSPIAYGESAQARLLEGCLARAAASPTIRGVLVEGWRDRGHTAGLLRPDGSERLAGTVGRHLLSGP
jgi:hypothetical protein